MEIKILNNHKKKRAFSNGLWFKTGEMFPWKYKYYQIGLLGFVFTITNKK